VEIEHDQVPNYLNSYTEAAMERLGPFELDSSSFELPSSVRMVTRKPVKYLNNGIYVG
jgi:hypothetical protein